MVYDRSEGKCLGDKPLTFVRCRTYFYEALEGWKFVGGKDYNLKDIKGKISFS